MIAVIDSTVLLHLIDPTVAVARHPQTEEIPTRCVERLDHFIDQLSRAGGRLIVPTPTLAEVLVYAGPAGPDWLNTLRGRKSIRIASFDERAAIECAALAADRKKAGRKSTRNKAKFDEQIIAIAKVENADLILSDDADILSLAPRGMQVKTIGDLDLPPEDPQGALALDA